MLSIPAYRYGTFDTFAWILFKRKTIIFQLHPLTAILYKKYEYFDFRISKKLTFFMFKHMFIQREKIVPIRQMFKISYNLKTDNFIIIWKKLKDIYNKLLDTTV